MRRIAAHSFGMTTIIRRALEGNVSPLNFVLIVGFFSSIVLLYIALHVHCYNVSQEINASADRLELLMDRNAFLTARFNDLSAPDRIIPIVEAMGMRPGTPEEVRKFALYEYRGFEPERIEGLADAARSGAETDRMHVLAVEPEDR